MVLGKRCPLIRRDSTGRRFRGGATSRWWVLFELARTGVVSLFSKVNGGGGCTGWLRQRFSRFVYKRCWCAGHDGCLLSSAHFIYIACSNYLRAKQAMPSQETSSSLPPSLPPSLLVSFSGPSPLPSLPLAYPGFVHPFCTPPVRPTRSLPSRVFVILLLFSRTFMMCEPHGRLVATDGRPLILFLCVYTGKRKKTVNDCRSMLFRFSRKTGKNHVRCYGSGFRGDRLADNDDGGKTTTRLSTNNNMPNNKTLYHWVSTNKQKYGERCHLSLPETHEERRT